jgi:regulator of protease activity HflC (stomatin/prohibitin superfamily)
MALFILGFILLLVAIFGTRGNSQLAKAKGILTLVSIILIAIGFFTSAIRQIDPGQVGVKVLFGKVEEGVLPEGLHVVNPLVDVKEMSVQTQNYTMSATYDEGGKRGDDAIRVLSKDGLEVVIDLTILYRVIPSKAPSIYRELGMDYQNKIIRPITRTGIREAASNYDAIMLFSEKREEFEEKVVKKIEKNLKDRGVELEKLLVRNIQLPNSVKQSIERKITAVQESQRMKFVLEKEKQEAERKRVEAQGNADAQRIVAQALTDKVLQFEMIKVQKELASSPNAKIILMGNSKNAPPFIIGK